MVGFEAVAYARNCNSDTWGCYIRLEFAAQAVNDDVEVFLLILVLRALDYLEQHTVGKNFAGIDH